MKFESIYDIIVKCVYTVVLLRYLYGYIMWLFCNKYVKNILFWISFFPPRSTLHYHDKEAIGMTIIFEFTTELVQT